jgi:hypothetical protein
MRTAYLYYAALLVMLAAQPHTSPAREVLPAAQEASYASAVQSFREQRYSAAYGRFARLADAGHAQSAQLALMMFRNGRALFGSDWDATPEQLERWSALVVNSERKVVGSADLEFGD